MWQRSQTIYLLLVIVTLALTLVFPFATFPFEDSEVSFNVFGVSKNVKDASNFFPYYISIALAIGLSSFAITQFKNRKRQGNLGKINYFVILVTIVMLFWESGRIADQLGIEEETIQYGVAMFLPVAAFAFTFLANRGIKKDEELIKSIDRLR